MTDRAGLVLAVAVALALAGCGRSAEPRKAGALPPAGSPHDDGRGLLARMSARPTAPGDAGPVEPKRPAGEFGGARYAGYGFTPRLDGVPTGPPSPYGDDYQVIAVEHGGTITGTVRWSRPTARPTGGCADPAAGTDRVGGAVVFLADIARGKSHLARGGGYGNRRLQVGGALELGPCGLAPRVQLAAPIGALLAIATRTGAARIGGRWSQPGAATGASTAGGATAAAAVPIEELALEPGAMLERMLERGGWLELTPRGGAPAWIVVQPHPYFALTGADGDFVLDRVPPGRYELVLWVAPLGGAPVVRRQRVQVRAAKRSTISVVLPR